MSATTTACGAEQESAHVIFCSVFGLCAAGHVLSQVSAIRLEEPSSEALIRTREAFAVEACCELFKLGSFLPRQDKTDYSYLVFRWTSWRAAELHSSSWICERSVTMDVWWVRARKKQQGHRVGSNQELVPTEPVQVSEEVIFVVLCELFPDHCSFCGEEVDCCWQMNRGFSAVGLELTEFQAFLLCGRFCNLAAPFSFQSPTLSVWAMHTQTTRMDPDKVGNNWEICTFVVLPWWCCDPWRTRWSILETTRLLLRLFRPSLLLFAFHHATTGDNSTCVLTH